MRSADVAATSSANCSVLNHALACRTSAANNFRTRSAAATLHLHLHLHHGFHDRPDQPPAPSVPVCTRRRRIAEWSADTASCRPAAAVFSGKSRCTGGPPTMAGIMPAIIDASLSTATYIAMTRLCGSFSAIAITAGVDPMLSFPALAAAMALLIRS